MELYDVKSATILLGCFMNDATLVNNSKYPINISHGKDKKDGKGWNDFSEKWQNLLYGVILNLANQGVRKIDGAIIYRFLENYPSQTEVLRSNDLTIEAINKIKEVSDVEGIDYSYNMVRKLSTLRFYSNLEWDISHFIDIGSLDFATEMQRLNDIEVNDIIDYFESKNSLAKRKFALDSTTEEMWCGENWEGTLDSLDADPMIGATLSSVYINSIFRGWNKGHLLLLSAPSGLGKTTNAIANLVKICALQIWDYDKNKYVDNPCRQGRVAFIHSEQDMEFEIQPKVISVISGVPYNVILNGHYDKETRERLSKAGKIMLESGFKIVNMPEFTVSKLENKIKDLALNDDAEYIVHDYLWNNMTAGAELKAKSGTPLREDMVLLQIANILKLSAERYNVGVMTMVQTNGKENEYEVVDERVLFGSKQLKTKLDCGYVLLQPRPKEEAISEESLVPMYNQAHRNNQIEPKDINVIYHVFKARYSSEGQLLRVWGHLDYGTGQFTDYFVTNVKNEFVNIRPIEVVNSNM